MPIRSFSRAFFVVGVTLAVPALAQCPPGGYNPPPPTPPPGGNTVGGDSSGPSGPRQQPQPTPPFAGPAGQTDPTGRTPGGTTPAPPPGVEPGGQTGPRGGGHGGATPSPVAGSTPKGSVPGGKAGGKTGGAGATPGHRKSTTVASLDWRAWWAVHRDLFVHVCPPAPIVSGSADFLLGRSDRTQAGSGVAMTLDLAREEIRPILREFANDRQTEVRVAVVKSLGKVGGAEAVHSILPLLRDPDPHVRSSAAAGLGYTGDACALPYLERLIDDSSMDLSTRGFAAIGAGILGGPDAVAVLEPLLDASTPSELRATAIVALGATQCPRGATLLRRFLRTQDPSSDDEALALESIARIDPADAHVVLVAATKAKSGLVRASAACALGGVEPEGAGRAALLSLVENDPDPNVRADAALALGRRRDEGAPKALARALDDANADVRPFAAIGLALSHDAEAGAILRRQFLDAGASQSMRGACAIALGILGDGAAIPTLRTAVRGADPEIRGWAVLALGLLGDRSLVPDLEAVLLEPHPSVSLEPYVLAAGLLGDRALIRQMQKALDDGCDRQRESTLVKASGWLREESFVKPCAAALRDVDRPESTRAHGAFALGALGDRLEVPALTQLVAWRNPLVHVGPLAALLAHL
jgi:HEAT repeat protein